MAIESTILAWGCVLALVHVFAAGHFKTQQYGVAWNTGPRDEELPAPRPLVGRLMRAQANYFETFPVVAIAIVLLAQNDIHTRNTEIGAMLWLAARVVYLPLYAVGVSVVRSLAFLASAIGMLMLLWPLLS